MNGRDSGSFNSSLDRKDALQEHEQPAHGATCNKGLQLTKLCCCDNLAWGRNNAAPCFPASSSMVTATTASAHEHEQNATGTHIYAAGKNRTGASCRLSTSTKPAGTIHAYAENERDQQ
jgi:hypothetical protein